MRCKQLFISLSLIMFLRQEYCLHLLLIHVQNTANISDSFIKKLFLSFVDDVITFVCL